MANRIIEAFIRRGLEATETLTTTGSDKALRRRSATISKCSGVVLVVVFSK